MQRENNRRHDIDENLEQVENICSIFFFIFLYLVSAVLIHYRKSADIEQECHLKIESFISYRRIRIYSMLHISVDVHQHKDHINDIYSLFSIVFDV